MLLGAVDLGSNSFRVEIGRVDGDRIVTQSYWKETIRMAAGFDKNGALTPEMQEKALAALSRFHEKLAGLPATQGACRRHAGVARGRELLRIPSQG